MLKMGNECDHGALPLEQMISEAELPPVMTGTNYAWDRMYVPVQNVGDEGHTDRNNIAGGSDTSGSSELYLSSSPSESK